MVTFDLESDIRKYLSNQKGLNLDRLLGEFNHYQNTKGIETGIPIGSIDPNLHLYNILKGKDVTIRIDNDKFSLAEIFTKVHDKALEVNRGNVKGEEVDPYITVTSIGKGKASYHYKGFFTLIALIMLARSSSFRSVSNDKIVKTANFSYLTKDYGIVETIASTFDDYIALARALADQNLLTSEMIRQFGHSVCGSRNGEKLDLVGTTVEENKS